MLRQAENRVKIEGILSEIDIRPNSFVNKNGEKVDSIGGTIKVKVNQNINGEDLALEVPIHLFASKKTKKGTLNPAYSSIERVANEFVSIAAADSEKEADKIRITNGKITMNEYYNNNGLLVSFPRVTTSFINKVDGDIDTEATFSVEFTVVSKDYEIAPDGTQTDRYKIQGALPQYGGKVDLITFYAINENVIDAVSNYWNVGDTVKASGKLKFNSETETYTTEVDFGEPIKNSRTITVSDLIITGGTQSPLEGEFAFDMEEIKTGLAERKANLDSQKERNSKPSSAPPKNSNSFEDLGF